MDGIEVAPSILSADFARLADQLEPLLAAGVRVVHLDVMDGHFVPPITFGPLIVAALREQVHGAGACLDVHLMVERPERHLEAFAESGADSVTIHLEATPHPHYALTAARRLGLRAGVALNPGTPAGAVAELGDALDHVLCMTVDPGWAGQRFIERSPEKVARLRELLPSDVPIQVDGGIDVATAVACRRAGAQLFVAASAIFQAGDAVAAWRELTRAVRAPAA
ncbi:ribulose-phosphate 3-epimerase [Thermoleophilum album]|uniref:Ribulose-phosphate 3-epimerase n=1 Tax=Thermoleophilum album TaxID=29539 RepID=A0A1H6FLA2_THEAL|nr:ribulose-phosphate 3-epimerase [Thermoleophilum album]SEH10623.1 ribulose-phosphate 3-epimerase [Thermoleophilum album]